MSPFFRNAGSALLGLLLCLPALSGTHALADEASDAAQPASLPDAPTPTADAQESAQPATATTSGSKTTSFIYDLTKLGPRRADLKTVAPGQVVAPLSAGEKVKLSLLEQIEPYAFVADLFVAGYQQLRDSDPKYGTDGGAFGQRLGAQVIRHASQGIFSDGLAAAAFHQDPRYYRLGTGRFDHRIYYALRRTWQTRTDSGAPQINYSLLVGNAGAAALTAAYYPSVSVTASKVAAGYGWSLFGTMVGNQYHEFWPDLLDALTHSKTKTAPTPKNGASGGD
jgi:hypothetical protein